MAQTTATFETGVNGAAISTGDTGSATAWDVRTNPGGNSITYDNSHAYGTLSAKVDSTTTAGSSNLLAWTTALGTLTDWYGRVYLYATANPSDSYRVSVDGNNNFVLYVTSSGTIQQYDQGGLIHATSASISLNQWVRLEWHWINSTSVGQVELRLFNSPDSSTATETKTSAANRNTSASTTDLSFGLSSGASATGPIWLDNIVAGATTWTGPADAGALAPWLKTL